MNLNHKKTQLQNKLKNKIALVTGSSGFIGSKLISFLSKKGYSVRILVRNEIKNTNFPGDIEIIYGDICDLESLGKAVQNVSIVFHLAAKLHVNNPDMKTEKEYNSVNVEGTANLLKVAKQAKVDRFIYFSTINVYGAGKSNIIFNETSPMNPKGSYAKSKCCAENIVKQSGVPFVILRLASVYGKGMKGNYTFLLKALRFNLPAMVGKGENRRTLIYIEDLLNAVLTISKHPEALGQIFNVTDGKQYEMNEIVSTLSSIIGRSVPNYKISPKLLRSVFGFFEKIFSLIGISSPVGHFTIDKLCEDIAVNGSKIQQTVGFSPQYDLRKGWEHTII